MPLRPGLVTVEVGAARSDAVHITGDGHEPPGRSLLLPDQDQAAPVVVVVGRSTMIIEFNVVPIGINRSPIGGEC